VGSQHIEARATYPIKVLFRISEERKLMENKFTWKTVGKLEEAVFL